jgi:hypothetical protein
MSEVLSGVIGIVLLADQHNLAIKNYQDYCTIGACGPPSVCSLSARRPQSGNMIVK